MRLKVHEAQLALLPVEARDVQALSGLVHDLVDFRDARDWKQFHRPKELATALSIEAAEVQELFLWSEPESSDDVRRGDPDRLRRITNEVADVAIYLLLLAHELQIDLSRAIAEKMAANERRFPVERTKGVAGKFATYSPLPHD